MQTTADRIQELKTQLAALTAQRLQRLVASRLGSAAPVTRGGRFQDLRQEYERVEDALADALAACCVLVRAEVDEETWTAEVELSRPDTTLADGTAIYWTVITRDAEQVDHVRWVEPPNETGRFATPYPWLKTTVAALATLTTAMHEILTVRKAAA